MYFEEFEIGRVYQLNKVKITKEKMTSFARSYDPLPLHLDEEYAKHTPFKTIIAPGVMTFMSVWTEFLKLNVFGDELIAGVSTHIQWLKPVFAEDELHGIVTVSALEPHSAKNGMVEVVVDITNQHGDLVIKDTTQSLIKRRQIQSI